MPVRKSLEKPLPLSTILAEILKPGDWQALELRQKIRAAWEDLIPARIRNHCRLRDLKKGILSIEVASPSLAQELHLGKSEIIRQLSLKIGPDIVRDLRFQ